MPESGDAGTTPAKAKLVTIDEYATGKAPAQKGKIVIEVDFNPQTLKLAFQSQTKGEKQVKSKGVQYVASSSSTLNVELIFDSTQTHNKEYLAGTDVRKKTKAIADAVMPFDNDAKTNVVQPLVRFEWGSFLFEGIVTGMSETLEYFSAQGVPLRATVALTLTRPSAAVLLGEAAAPNKTTTAPPGSAASGTPDTTPKTPTPAGDSLQKAAARNGSSSDWRSIANANNIDNPLRLPMGKPLDLNPLPGGSAGLPTGLGSSFQPKPLSTPDPNRAIQSQADSAFNRLNQSLPDSGGIVEPKFRR